jgi:exopolyphosphatase/guanosine-5'-triphosphate,3'-diphosphate pyrophosphatase
VSPRVGVIDIGSNSIKALVAQADGEPTGLRAVFERTLEVRISQGIGGDHPRLQADRIEAGVEAVRTLYRDCAGHGPLAAMRIVATSAVRSAANGHLFTGAVARITGMAPDILTGAEEADAIALGVRTDPAISGHLRDFTVFDLGGGSLEIIRFAHGGVVDRTSLPLGAVRLTEQFVADPSRPVAESTSAAIDAHVRRCIAATGIALQAPLVGCSGGLASLRDMLNPHKRPEPVDRSASAILQAHAINALGRRIRAADLAGRMAIPGMPARRADIFPAACVVFSTLLELGGADRILHSFHNLRYGLALGLLRAINGKA